MCTLDENLNHHQMHDQKDIAFNSGYWGQVLHTVTEEQHQDLDLESGSFLLTQTLELKGLSKWIIGHKRHTNVHTGHFLL